MTERRPMLVEILVDGRKHHTFLAERLVTNEDREQLTLEAHRWQPSTIVLPDDTPDTVTVNGLPQPVTGHKLCIDRTADLDVLGEMAADFLTMPIDDTQETR